MSRFSKKALFRFNLRLSLLGLFFVSQIFTYGILLGLQVGLLIWSLFILCIPIKHGNLILGVPYRFITKKKFKYPEIYMWASALIFSVTELLVTPLNFFKSAFTHLLYRILTTPWPYWLVLVTAAACTFYPFLVSTEVTIKTPKHFLIQKAIFIIALITLAYFAFADFVILLNMHAS